VQITGYHVFFRIKQENIKKSVQKRIREKIEEENAEHFVFAANDIDKLVEWEEDGKEFRYQGEMYDVIEKRTENGKVVIKCISDKKETELVKNYKNITKDDFSGTSKKRTTLLLKLIVSLYAPLTTPVTADASINSGKINWVTYKCPLIFNTTEVLTPPPQLS